MRACARIGAEHARVAHRTAYRACPVHHRTAKRAHKSELQRSEPNGRVTWLAHPTVSGAPVDNSLHQRSSLVVGAINTPTTPTFKSSKFSTFQLLTRALAFNSRHNQIDQILSQLQLAPPCSQFKRNGKRRLSLHLMLANVIRYSMNY
jgi:hypothetical protein